MANGLIQPMASGVDPTRPPETGEHCHTCAQQRHFTVATSWERPHDDSSTAVRWVIRRCTVCDEPHVVKEVQLNSELSDVDPVTDARHWDTAVLYPKLNHLSLLAPQELREDYDRAQQSIIARADLAAALLLRRGLHQVCRDHQVPDAASLIERLRCLHELVALPEDLLRWATSIRVLADDQAQNLVVSPDDVIACTRFFEALCGYLYSYRRQCDVYGATSPAPPPAVDEPLPEVG